MSKNIVIFSDGTGQRGGNGPNTNIYKYFNIIEDRTPQQISFYDPGVGHKKGAVVAQGSGLGFTKNIRQCYQFIFNNYEAGDKIFLFGFSRGAATVRSLSGFIHLFGILPKSRQDLIDEAWNIYKINNIKKRRSKAQAFIRRHHTMWAHIEFIGAFDTVAALGQVGGLIKKLLNKSKKLKHDYHDFSLSESVKNARHAIAIDDQRKTFHPVLWNPNIKETQSLKQVWFMGAHTDVGGGYKEHGLSDISYQWMLNEAKQFGLKIYDESRVQLGPDPNGKMHEEKYAGTWPFKYSTKNRKYPFGQPTIHPSVLKRTRGRHNEKNKKYKPWILKGEYLIEGHGTVEELPLSPQPGRTA